MAKKGKEIDLRGFRIQIDPLIIITRVMMRQKLLLAGIGFLGIVISMVMYKTTPKKYQSSSQILIRAESFEEAFLTKAVNTAVGNFGSDNEMMLLINELDLFADMRRKLPYELALRTIRKELKVTVRPRSIGLAYMSNNPLEAQRVVAFATERLIHVLANLNEAGSIGELDAVDRAISDIAPKKKVAEDKLYAFKAQHPEIAVTVEVALPGEGGGSGIDAQIQQAERELADARAGKAPTRRAGANNSPVYAAMMEAKANYEGLARQYTENHPEVLTAKRKYMELQAAAQREAAAAEQQAGVQGANAEEIQKSRVAAAEGRLRDLIARKTELTSKQIKKPELQREWAELSLNASTMASEMKTLAETRNKILRDRLVAANKFQEDFQLVDAPRVPELPAEPDRNQFLGIGIAITLVVGILICGGREAVRQTFVDASEFEEQTGVQVFAVLPNIRRQQGEGA